MALTPEERETSILFSDGDDGLAYVFTYQRKVITALKKNPSATLTEEGRFMGTPFANFTIPANLVSFRKNRRKQLTESQRQDLRTAINERKPWERKGTSQ